MTKAVTSVRNTEKMLPRDSDCNSSEKCKEVAAIIAWNFMNLISYSFPPLS